MRSTAVAVGLVVASSALFGCGGSGDDSSASTSSPTTQAQTPPATQTTAPTSTSTSAPADDPTTTSEVSSAPDPTDAARAFAAAYKAQDWPKLCRLYSPSAIKQLEAGAKESGTGGNGCAEILSNVLGEGLEAEPLDVSGTARVDGDQATVGEVALELVDGRWLVSADRP